MISLHIHSTRTRFHSVKTLADTKLEGERRVALTSLSTEGF